MVGGHPEVSAGQRAGPPLLVAAVTGSASQFSFVSHPSVSSTVGWMPECHSLGCLLVPWLTTRFPSPENRQKEQLSTKGRPFRGMSEEEVFTEVANLFRGQEDLLSEFGQFLPEAKRSLVSTDHRRQSGATFSSARTPCQCSPQARPGLSTPQTHWVPSEATASADAHRPPVQAPPPRGAGANPQKGFSGQTAAR